MFGKSLKLIPVRLQAIYLRVSPVVPPHKGSNINPLSAELNPICHLLALLGAHHIFHVSWLRVNILNSDRYHFPSHHRILPITLQSQQTNREK